MKNKIGQSKQHPEVVEALRQLAYRYKIDTAQSIERAREILDKAAKKSGKTLSETVREIRDEE